MRKKISIDSDDFASSLETASIEKEVEQITAGQQSRTIPSDERQAAKKDSEEDSSSSNNNRQVQESQKFNSEEGFEAFFIRNNQLKRGQLAVTTYTRDTVSEIAALMGVAAGDYLENIIADHFSRYNKDIIKLMDKAHNERRKRFKM